MSPRFPVLLILLVGCASPTPRSHTVRESCIDRVCLQTRSVESGYAMSASNRLPAAVSFDLEFLELVNLESSRPLPVLRVVPAQSEVELLTLGVRESSQGASYHTQFKIALGNPAARHEDGVLYRMPFGGSRDRILSQGVDGGVSHQGARRHAFDFEMESGTRVLAARDGIVVRVRDGFGPGGLDAKRKAEANVVTLAHSDGTFASYGHLRKGIPVQVGDRAIAGDLLAYSGNSGYSSGPHLHFHVWKHGSDVLERTLPIRFTVDGRSAFVPSPGHPYPANQSSTRVVDN